MHTQHYFTPGPSQLAPGMASYMAQAVESGLLSRWHRSAGFLQLMQEAKELLHTKLALPEEYHVYVVSSATECWQILTDSGARNSFHAYSGAFGQRWWQAAAGQGKALAHLAFDASTPPAIEELASQAQEADMLCLTHNETSNGSRLTHAYIDALRQALPNTVLALDATSSLGAVQLPWASIDYAFASVQKGLGLPPGMALLFASPRAVARFTALNASTPYNALPHLHARAQQHQTTHTPNILGVYLLKRVLESRPAMDEIAQQTQATAKAYYDLLYGLGQARAHIKNEAPCSETVVCVETEVDIPTLLAEAEEAGFVLGQGYGPLHARTFRIATFPAIPATAHAELRLWLKNKLA